MRSVDPLEHALADEAIARLTAGDWTPISVSGGAALRGIEFWLADPKGVATDRPLDGLVVIVCRRPRT